MKNDMLSPVIMALKAFGIAITYLCDVIFHISRPTFYRYVEKFDDGEEYKIPMEIRQFFKLITKSGVTKQEVEEYLAHVKQLDAAVRISSDNDLLRGLSVYDAEDNSWVGGKLLLKNKEGLSEPLSFDDAINAIKGIIVRLLESINSMHFGSDRVLPPNFVFQYASDECRHYTFSYIYTKVMEELVQDPLISESKIDAVRKLSTNYDYALECIHYVLSSVNDLDDTTQYDDVVSVLNRPTFDVMKPLQMYLVAGLYNLNDEKDDGNTLFHTYFVEAVSEEDAWQVFSDAIPTKIRQTPFKAVLFGPFTSKKDVEKLDHYLDVDWELNFGIMSESKVPAIEWLDGQLEKKALKGGATDSPYSQ